MTAVPPMAAANGLDDEQRHSHVQTGILDDHSDHQTPEEHHCGVVHVTQASVAGRHDAHQRIQDYRDQARDGQRQDLGHPEHRHQRDDVQASHSKRLRISRRGQAVVRFAEVLAEDFYLRAIRGLVVERQDAGRIFERYLRSYSRLLVTESELTAISPR